MQHGTLLLDDDPISSFLFSKMLEKLDVGLPEGTFLKGQDLLEWLKTRISEKDRWILYLDIMMPQMDGWEVLERLVEMGLSERMLVVMVSSSISPLDRERAMNHRLVVEYLTKPIRQHDLERTRAAIALLIKTCY